MKQVAVTFEKPSKLDDKHQQIMDKLAAAEGQKFDEAFKAAQIDAPQEGIALFQSYANKGDKPELKQFAAKTLPVLEHHLQMVEQIQP